MLFCASMLVRVSPQQVRNLDSLQRPVRLALALCLPVLLSAIIVAGVHKLFWIVGLVSPCFVLVVWASIRLRMHRLVFADGRPANAMYYIDDDMRRQLIDAEEQMRTAVLIEH